MSKQAKYKTSEIYQVSKKLTVACYELTQDIPEDEKTHFSGYIRTAALCAHINIAKTFFSKSKKKKLFKAEARTCLVVIESATTILVEVGFSSAEDAEQVNRLCACCFELLDNI